MVIGDAACEALPAAAAQSSYSGVAPRLLLSLEPRVLRSVVFATSPQYYSRKFLRVWQRPRSPTGFLMLARSAWAGSQRFGAAVWSGDTQSNFANLQEQFRAGLNMAMSGFSYWTTDIGGYSGGDIDDPVFRELIVRWFQWGAFCPLFRLHGSRSGGPSQEGGDARCGNTNAANEIWHFGTLAEASIGRVMALREQLRPYVARRFAEVAATGAPVMRPMFFDFWTQPSAFDADDQMMFGPDYMVAPQLLQNTTRRAVWMPRLPATHAWKNVFTGVVTNTSAGAVNITEATPLQGEGFGTFPLYYREPL